MSDPLSILQPTVRSALVAHAPLTALVGQRVYGEKGVPRSPTFPYCVIEAVDAVEDDDSCGRHWRCTVQVNIWSNAQSRQEVDSIAGPVRDALDAITSVTGYRLNYGQYRNSPRLSDPDPLILGRAVIYELHLAAT